MKEEKEKAEEMSYEEEKMMLMGCPRATRNR